jgi:small GTP-binding protein
MSEGNTVKLKIIIIGEPAVGKTSLVRRFVSNRFSKDYRSTIGTNIFMKNIELGDGLIKLALWDIAGQERWLNMRHKYYRGAQGAFIVGDLTREDTFTQIENFWYDDLKSYLKSIPIILIANKNDLTSNISEKTIKEIQKKINAEVLYFTSAKTGDHVDEAFNKLSTRIRQLQKK